MIVLEVSRNGKLLCTAGVGDNGVLDADVHWNGQRGRVAHPHLVVGGLDGDTRLHLSWIDRTIRVGDVITIKVVEKAEADPPKKRHGPAV